MKTGLAAMTVRVLRAALLGVRCMSCLRDALLVCCVYERACCLRVYMLCCQDAVIIWRDDAAMAECCVATVVMQNGNQMGL